MEELRLVALQMGLQPGPTHWVTSRTPHTEALLAGRTVHWMPHVASGDVVGAMRNLPRALALHRRVRPELVVTTGAAAAAPHLLVAAALRCPIRYVESATRRHGPSATGRLAQRLPRTALYAQGGGWGDARWQTIEDVFSAYQVESASREGRPRRALVSLGTERYPFLRAVRNAERVLRDLDVVWQTGSTRVVRDGELLPQWMPGDRLRAACREADVVITHAGVGSVLTALGEGKVPVILPRQHEFGEHIDDHQLEAAQLLETRGLAVCADPDRLSQDHLERAFAMRARLRSEVLG